MTEGEPTDEFESILAETIERVGQDGSSALELACARYPDFANRLRDRIASLRLAGFLVVPDAATELLFGRYRIVRPLGRGAMGVVFLADDVVANRRVALKTCAFANVDAARERERFLREGNAAKRLTHENIVPVLDVGGSADIAFLAMEAIEGATLAEILAKLRDTGAKPGDLGVEDVKRALVAARPDVSLGDSQATARFGRTYVELVCRIGRDIARALDHVHGHGVVHRDVKPSNILLEHTGRALLFDLGLAHIDDAPALTRTGEFAGSPYYASPEQVAGLRGAIDARTDVYSLGVTLFELLALEVPFHPEDAATLFRAIQTDDAPPLRDLSPLVPRDLEVIVATALEKEPHRRYSSARALADDLERFLTLRPIAARPRNAVERLARQARRRPAVTVACALLAIVLVGSPIVLAWFNHEIAIERDQATHAEAIARREAERNREVSAFWEELVLELDQSGDASMRASAEEILRRGAVHVGHERLDQPLSQALVLETLGRVHVQLGRAADALTLFDQALALRTATLGEAHVETATALYRLANTHLDLDHREDARALATRAIASFFEAGEPRHEFAALAEVVLGDVAQRDGLHQLARERHEAALSILDTERVAPGRRADVLERLGESLLGLGIDDGATTALEESLELRRAERRPRAENIAAALALLARSKARRDDTAAAIDLYAESLALERKSHGDIHPSVARVLEELTAILPGVDADATPKRHAFVGLCFYLWSSNLRASGGGDPSVSLDRAISHLERSGELGALHLAAARTDSAEAHLEVNRLDAADALAASALEIPSEVDPRLARRALAVRAETAKRRGDFAVALSHRERALEVVEADPAATPREIAGELLETADARRAADAPDATRLERRAADLLLAPTSRELPAALALDPAYPLRRAAPDVLAAYDEEFQRGITALQSARRVDAIVHFEACQRLVPRVPICSYNVACARSLEGDIDGAITALERAIDDGFGFRESDLALLQTDSDLVAARRDARFAGLLDRVHLSRNAAAREASEPAFYLPETVDPKQRAALLVVVHRHGSSKAQIVESVWRDVARELGMILVAPSGQYVTPAQENGPAAMTWVEDIARYERRAWLDDRPVVEAIAAARRLHRVDPSRVFLAGEGVGGIIAFDVALRAPGSFRGVLLHNASVHFALARDLAAELRAAGLKLVLVPERHTPVEGLATPRDADEHAPELAAAIESLGVDVVIIPHDTRAIEARLHAGLLRLLGP